MQNENFENQKGPQKNPSRNNRNVSGQSSTPGKDENRETDKNFGVENPNRDTEINPSKLDEKKEIDLDRSGVSNTNQGKEGYEFGGDAKNQKTNSSQPRRQSGNQRETQQTGKQNQSGGKGMNRGQGSSSSGSDRQNVGGQGEGQDMNRNQNKNQGSNQNRGSGSGNSQDENRRQ